MRRARVALMTMALTVLASMSIVAQQSALADPARDQIRQTLRAFYFNLARGDWEAMTADILAAKVVAHRAPPQAAMSGGGSPQLTNDATGCARETANTSVDRATIKFEADWARVSVPRCGSRHGGADQFRLIRFQGRWRFVSITLVDQAFNLSNQP